MYVDATAENKQNHMLTGKSYAVLALIYDTL